MHHIYPAVAELNITNLTSDTIIYDSNNKQINIDIDDLYVNTDYTLYNKSWGKMNINVESDNEDISQAVNYTLTVPNDYITVTYNGLTDTFKENINSITLSYDQVTFTYDSDSLPITLALPNNVSTSVTLKISAKGYKAISRTDIIVEDTTIILEDTE